MSVAWSQAAALHAVSAAAPSGDPVQAPVPVPVLARQLDLVMPPAG